ncbi:uncharacterized protein LOC130246305 [Danio aesculapii]|uniref:uncharacterized protein LOC130246305 n=1 Tax=Danio aesculapii TaxID=1142201 RepID=UPI0024C0AC18|nr:uncharacterized protein LOC130246305 [Danio aesculapii]
MSYMWHCFKNTERSESLDVAQNAPELQAKYLIPSSTIQMIVEQIDSLNSVCHQYVVDLLQGALQANTQLRDNLGSHQIGGFTENFSVSTYFCRYCLATRNELHDLQKCAPPRTVQNYNEAVQEPGLPPCIAHDVFEGVVAYDLAIYIKYFVKVKKFFTYSQLNRRIKQFSYHGSDATSTPSVVAEKGDKLGGKAAENWCLLRLLPILIVMDYVDDDLANFVGFALQNSSSKDLVLEALQNLGVGTLEDLKYVQEPDLVNVLRPIEVRKFLARIKALSEKDASEVPDLPARAQLNATPCQGHTSTYCVDISNSPPSTSSSEASASYRHTPVDNNWHFSFEIPWSKIPSEITRKLENKERPTGRERRELIRLMVSEILTICPTPGKKHLSEIARKIVAMYPQSFKDVIEDQVVGSGYDSLTKQLQSRVDNMKRGKISLYLKRQTSSASEGDDTPFKIKRVDTYGCINWQPKQLPEGETEESQKCIQEELKTMHKNKCNNTKDIEKKMMDTFYNQRRNIISGMDTPLLVEEWPYLFEMCGLIIHFKELTGLDVDREAVSSNVGESFHT